jgi:hypothetical protein
MSQINIRIPQKRIEKFCQKYKITRMALFGSVLQEDFNRESDVDVLVVFDPTARVTFLTLGEMERGLSEIFNRPVDLVPQAGLKPTIRESILSSAVEVYSV